MIRKKTPNPVRMAGRPHPCAGSSGGSAWKTAFCSRFPVLRQDWQRMPNASKSNCDNTNRA